jgi:photosystem II stability/assembly factor-like uncharacterized protein
VKSIRPLALLLLAILLPSCGREAAASTRPVTLLSVRMAGAAVGWGISRHQVLRTVDGGAQWTPVHAVRDGMETELTALGGKRAWVVTAAPNGRADQMRSVVLSTGDGGRTWTTSAALRGIPFPPTTPEDSDLSFTDPTHGWTLTSEGAGMGQASYDLYRTVDGGRHWQLVAYTHHPPSNRSRGGLPACNCLDGFSFMGHGSGWATGAPFATPRAIILYRTENGGKSWQARALSPPGGYRRLNIATAPPAFFGSTGLLPAHMFSPSAFVLYVSHDGGTSWSPTTPIRQHIPGSPGAPDAFALTGTEAWTWVDRTLYRTTDAGQHWRAVGGGLKLAGTPELQFVTARTGFALSGFTGKRQTYLLRTDDGGRTWRKVQTVLAG